MNLPDTQLLNQMRAGDAKAFEQLYRVYATPLLSFAGKRLMLTQDAEEIVQEVFLQLWERRAALDIDHSLKAYLFTAVRNQIYMRYRSWLKHQQHWRVPALEDADYRVPALEQLDYQDLEKKMHLAIEQLPEKCREVFLLSRMEQLSNKAIAERLQISVSTVEKHIWRALQILRVHFKHDTLLAIAVVSFLFSPARMAPSGI